MSTANGNVLVITGASRGIGAATARLAGARGWAVAVNYNANPDKAAQVVRDIEKAGGKAVAIQGDVSTEEGVVHLFSETDKQLGTVTALFNNAGIVPLNKLITEVDAASLERVWRINMTGKFLAAREAVKRMSTKAGGKGGAIVNMSSAAAYIGGGGGMLAYAASKGSMDTFTLGMAQECGPQGIRVNAVRPGLIETTIHDDSGVVDRIKKLVHMVPMGRSGEPEEVAELVLYLLSPAASYVNGAIVNIGGGR
jgi:NAD(P)-dependent dehydrogenase (short-subunit alcohol dehydrogenase family)